MRVRLVCLLCLILISIELLEQGLKEVVCLEQAADVGGVFGKTYDSLVLTSSLKMIMA